jgi:peptidylprolyl isomerase
MSYQKHFIAFYIIFSCSLAALGRQPFTEDPQIKVLVSTSFGDIKIRLYNETPLHRDNFLKLVKENYFDSLLFHRVIQQFMIQGGDPDSRHAPPGTLLGEGGPPYTIPAEFNPKLFHKKGVLAAARDSDLENPTQASSACQFYIVQGKIFTDSLLTVQAKRITRSILFNRIINRPENALILFNYKRYVKADVLDSVKYVNDIMNKKVDAELPTTVPYQFSKEQIAAYTTTGGTPHLDNSYTIFGEVYEGLEIVDKIAAQKVDKNNRPLDDIRILKISVIP